VFPFKSAIAIGVLILVGAAILWASRGDSVAACSSRRRPWWKREGRSALTKPKSDRVGQPSSDVVRLWRSAWSV